MSYTENFTEVNALLANLTVNASAAEQNTGYVEVGDYHRVFVQVIPVDLGGDLDVDIEEATDTTGTGVQAFQDGDFDVTVAAADTNPTAMNIQTEQFDVSDGYDAINVEVTPGAASTYVVQVFGCVPRKPPVPTTNWEEVVE